MNPDWLPSPQQIRLRPLCHPRFAQALSQSCVPARELNIGNGEDVGFDLFGKRRPQIALSVDECDQNRVLLASTSWTTSGRTNAAPHFSHLS